MKVEQIFELVNDTAKNVLGKEEDVLKQDLTNVVDLGREIMDLDQVDNYVRKLVDHIGKVIFVNRVYSGGAPSVLMRICGSHQGIQERFYGWIEWRELQSGRDSRQLHASSDGRCRKRKPSYDIHTQHNNCYDICGRMDDLPHHPRTKFIREKSYNDRVF